MRILQLSESEQAAVANTSIGTDQVTVLSVLQDAVILAQSIASPNTEVSLNCSIEIPCTFSDANLFRVVANLANNAVAAVNDAGGGHVQIRATISQASLVIEVSDDGPGMAGTSSASMDAVPGQRRRSGYGTTIATLAACRLGGTVDVERTGSDGTIVSVAIPLGILGQPH